MSRISQPVGVVRNDAHPYRHVDRHRASGYTGNVVGYTAEGGALWLLRSVVVVLAVLVTACGSDVVTPTAPTPPQTQTTTPTPPPPPPASDLSPFVGVWNVTLHLTEVNGDSGCIAEALKSQLEVPGKSSLTITQSSVTITDPPGDYACTFNSFQTDSGSFTTSGVPGYFACQRPTLAVRCREGSLYDLFSWGQDITARLSGTEISGTWVSVFYYQPTGGNGVEITAEFKGSR
jgi:hypothetical protein